MPIKPIDLQTLFLQMNKVGKEQAAVKDGAVLQQSIQSAVQAKKREDEVRSVQKPQADEGAGRIGDRESKSPAGEESEEKRKDRDSGEPEEPEVVKDPDLGRRIDIQG